MRIAYVSNYSPVTSLRLSRAGEYPRQHLYGADTLDRHEVAYVPLDRNRTLKALSGRLRDKFGDLDLAFRLLRARPRPDAIFAQEARVIQGLIALRGAGLLDTPIAAVIHADMPATAFNRLRNRGIDFAFAMTRRIERQLREEFGRDPDTLAYLPWGPDLGFPLYTSLGEERIVSTGKTHRDTATLLAALSGSGLPARVYVRERPAAVPDGVELVVEDRPVGYLAPLDDLRRASVVAVPLAAAGAPYGITELNDALALAKPVVMTRSPHIDIDIEAVGCGLWVDPGDVDGWRSALTRLASDPALRARMGAAGREFAERSHNYRLCGQVVAEGLDRLERRMSGAARRR